MKVDVVYLVESVAKELDVACIVRLLAKRRYGIDIEIASYKFDVAERLLRARPRLLVVPTCYAANAWGMRKHVGQWPGTPILNLTWEELFCKANLTWKHPRDVFAQKHVQHHVWGDFYKPVLTSHGVPPEHVFVNGNPGYRLYGEPYRGYFPTREQLAATHQLDPAKRWIFLPENYGFAFYSAANIATRIKEGMDPATPPLLQEYCRTTLKSALDWCQALTRIADVEMIIRPRPTTSQSEFERVCRELAGRPLDGIRFIKDGPVNQWILASDVVVSSFSTSLLEASIAGKPAYMLEPKPLPDPLWSIWNDDADSLTTQDAFLAACLDERTAARDQKLNAWAHANLLAHGDPIENLVEYIARVCDGRVTLPSPGDHPPLVVRRRDGLVKGVARRTWHQMQQLMSPARAGEKHSMAFSAVDVAQKTKDWTHVLEASEQVAVG